MSYLKNNDPNLPEKLEKEYSDFLKTIGKEISTYIELNRSLLLNPNQEKIENINKNIKELIEKSKYLKKYLSHLSFKRRIDKMILSNESGTYCSRKTILEELGDGIKKLRKSQNITMKQLAEIANVSIPFVSKIENYYIARPPKCIFIHKITSYYEYDMEYVFGIIDSPKCIGDMCYKPITMVTDGDYPIFFSAFPQYYDIAEMLKELYYSDDAKAIESLRTFLSKLTENVKNS